MVDVCSGLPYTDEGKYLEIVICRWFKGKEKEIFNFTVRKEILVNDYPYNIRGVLRAIFLYFDDEEFYW